MQKIYKSKLILSLTLSGILQFGCHSDFKGVDADSTVNANLITLDVETLNQEELGILSKVLGEINGSKIAISKNDMFFRISLVYYEGLENAYLFSGILHTADSTITLSVVDCILADKTVYYGQEAHVANEDVNEYLREKLWKDMGRLSNELIHANNLQELSRGQPAYLETYNGNEYKISLFDLYNSSNKEMIRILADIIAGFAYSPSVAIDMSAFSNSLSKSLLNIYGE
ncbi:MAG TPA: hypothetical protein PKN63_11835 [Chitinophagales bacterium]|nr:hypothetical protein [Chitinophagales bacterium]